MGISVGIRELRQHASRYIRRVRAGETITITDRGEPVATLSPVMTPDRESILDRLVREGRVTPAEGDLEAYLRKHPPMPLAPGKPSPSEILEEMRRDER